MSYDTDSTLRHSTVPCKYCGSYNTANLPLVSEGIFTRYSSSNMWICADCGKITLIPVGHITK